MSVKDVSIAEYLKIRYGVDLAPWELKLPLLHLTQRGEDIYLVPSRCNEASLPKDFTSDPRRMTDLRSNMISDPDIRFQRVGGLV